MNLLTCVVFLVMFSVLVAVHELGHYLFARKFNMGGFRVCHWNGKADFKDVET